MNTPRYSIADLEELTGQPRRTIHHYISTGLLPRAEGKGPSAYYTREHFLKLRLVSLLVEAGLRPELIQNSLEGWSEEDMERLVGLAEGQQLDDLDKISRWMSKASAAPGSLGRLARRNAPSAAKSPAASPVASRIAEYLEEWGHSLEEVDPSYSEELFDRSANIQPAADELRSEAASLNDLSATSLPASDTWERIRIGDALEISYRAPVDRSFARKIDALRDVLQQLFAEEIDRAEAASRREDSTD